MKRIKLIVLVGYTILMLIQCRSTQKIVSQKSDYSPQQTGNYWIYKYVNSNNTLTVNIIDDNIEINGKKYFKIKRVYSWRDDNIDYSRMEGGTLYNYDDKTKGESIAIPKEIIVGRIWKHIDGSWEYEILSTNDTLNLPTGKYNELLKIRATQLTNRDKDKCREYNLYYKKGIGNVAIFGNGELMTYLTEFKIK